MRYLSLDVSDPSPQTFFGFPPNLPGLRVEEIQILPEAQNRFLWPMLVRKQTPVRKSAFDF